MVWNYESILSYIKGYLNQVSDEIESAAYNLRVGDLRYPVRPPTHYFGYWDICYLLWPWRLGLTLFDVPCDKEYQELLQCKENRSSDGYVEIGKSRQPTYW